MSPDAEGDSYIFQIKNFTVLQSQALVSLMGHYYLLVHQDTYYTGS